MKKCNKRNVSIGLAAVLGVIAGSAVAHDPGSSAGTPVCIESNLMAADAQNGPFSNVLGPGRVIEMNTTTGERGITVNRPFNAGNASTLICTQGGVDCPGPWKPTGVLSGGEDGHSIITSAAQHALTTFHRNGTPIMTAPTLPTSPSPNGGGYGQLPRLLGTGYMPNGNIAQTVCDANFFNGSNSDGMGAGESGITFNAFPGPPAPTNNSSLLYFPPVYSTAARGANGRVLVIDQVTLETIDEYSIPTTGPYANDPRWNCPAGVIFTSEGLYVSMFHGAAVFVIDWKDGVEDSSAGVGANESDDDDDDDGDHGFKLDKKKNQAKIIRVIDLLDETGAGAPDAPNYDSPHRRDNLRAIRMAEDGSLFGTFRARSRECLRGEAPGAVVPVPSGNPPCNPSVFRQHQFVVNPGENHKSGTIALDPGVNVIAGTTINRMTGPGCDFVQQEALNANGVLTGDECDVETLQFGVSAGNAGCDANGDGIYGPGHPANQCFKPGGTIYEYRIDAAHWDGGSAAGDGSGDCSGSPGVAGDTAASAGNGGCAMPIAQFNFISDGVTSGLPVGAVENLDPRMVMTIHEAFTQ